MIQSFQKAPALGLMAILLLFGFPGNAQMQASSQNRQTTYSNSSQIRSIQLSDALTELKQKYRVDILFELKTVEGIVVRQKSIDLALSLEQNLDKLLLPLGLKYKKFNRTSYVVKENKKPKTTGSIEQIRSLNELTQLNRAALELQPSANTAQDPFQQTPGSKPPLQTIIGKVMDETGQGLPGVTILVKNTQLGTTTDVDGSFRIELSEAQVQLVFSFVGYITQELTAKEGLPLVVTLVPDAKALSEVVVVGYGTQKKKDLTGSVVRIDPKLNESSPNVNAVQNLRGSVAGVRVIDGGRPGADGTISIRGNSSISASNAPLIVLDGIIYTGGLSDINSNDIESMDILKDASSASIYGSRATNGVILITTKKGASAKPKFNYNTYYGMSDYSHTPQLMGPERYLAMKKDASAFLGRPITLQAIEEANVNAGISIDPWQAIAQSAPMSNHELSVSGRYEKVNYYISGSYTDMKGRIIGDNFSRLSARLNLEVAATDWLNIGTNSGYTKKDYSGVPANLEFASYLSPFSSFFYEDGAIRNLPMGDGIAPNPIRASLSNDNLQLTNTFFNNLYADLALPISGLSYRLNLGNNFRFNDDANFTPSINEPRDGLSRLASGSKSHRKHHYLTLEHIVKYQKALGQYHNVDLTLLQSFEMTNESGSSLSSNNIFNDALSYNGLGIGENPTVSSSALKSTANSYMGRIGYKFKNRYVFNATVRRDGYSAFGSGRKYGVFPSMGIGWLISEEKFMKDVPLIGYLKLRYTYGKNGNRGISPYSSQTNLTQTGNQYVFGDAGVTSIGITPTSMSNNNLGWETTVASNLGLDFSILNEKISGSIEYYSKNTSDLLLQLRIPNMTGYETYFTNIGGTNNQGLEISLNTQNFSKAKFKWTSNLVYSFNRNKITKLSGVDLNKDGVEDDDIASSRFIGKPLGTNFDYVWDGIWQVGEDNKLDPTSKPGYVKFKDVDGDGKLTPLDRQVLHSNQPDFLAGLTNRFSYGGLSLSIFFNAVIGGYSPNSLLNHGTNFFDRTNLMDLPYWTPENPLSDRPSIGYPNPLGYRFYQSRSFVRLQDISLSYDLPKNVLSKAKIGSVKVYVSGKNLKTWTKWDGWDPEHGSGGRTPANGPLLSSWIMGLNIGL
ncbi:SusC/RagA family TonB-linked outer membrane protein [Haliscomenobacter sp.]|uniref:SusC/RagA family TonB-linked outer membrane protein n=1 Tax=Haliscomenobacter sp. TaxID=2717303 RepID=UPI003BADA0E7